LVLAGLGKFTLWGAVLVDVGTALCVILHGMLLMRWRLPGAKPSAKYSATCVERHEPLAANGITGQSSCCYTGQGGRSAGWEFVLQRVSTALHAAAATSNAAARWLLCRMRMVLQRMLWANLIAAAATSNVVTGWLLMTMRMVLQIALLADLIAAAAARTAVVKLQAPPTVLLASLLVAASSTVASRLLNRMKLPL
jgi:hypothetical protein